MHDTFALSRIGLKPLAACLIADKQAGRRRFFSNRDLHFRFRLERCQHEVPAFLGAIVGIASSQTSANIDMKSQLSRYTFRELQFPCRWASFMHGSEDMCFLRQRVCNILSGKPRARAQVREIKIRTKREREREIERNRNRENIIDCAVEFIQYNDNFEYCGLCYTGRPYITYRESEIQ